MKYFRGTKQECQDLINRLNSLYGFPNDHTYSFGIEEEYNNDYIVRIKDRHINDLTNDEKSKVEDLTI
tara:strand:- start:219 stop:422 length:204 start_codon:yes stop_codon:yes gene_type:complete